MSNKKARKIRLVAIVVIVLLAVLCVISSKHRKAELKREMELRQETHSGIADLERYVYDTVGPDIYFKQPVIDDEKRTADLYLIQPENELNMSLFDEARQSINDYLINNSGFFLNDGFRITLYYQSRVAIIHYDYEDDQIGYSQNYFDYGGYSVNGSDRGAEQIHLKFDEIVMVAYKRPFSSSVWNVSDDIKVIYLMGSDPTLDELLDIVTNVPSLKYLYISNWEREEDELLLDSLKEVGSDVVILINYRGAPTSACVKR